MTSFAEKIETPYSPIIETEEPAPTALSDEEDYECDQLFICSVPNISKDYLMVVFFNLIFWKNYDIIYIENKERKRSVMMPNIINFIITFFKEKGYSAHRFNGQVG